MVRTPTDFVIVMEMIHSSAYGQDEGKLSGSLLIVPSLQMRDVAASVNIRWGWLGAQAAKQSRRLIGA